MFGAESCRGGKAHDWQLRAQETEFMVLLPTECGHDRWAVGGGQRHVMCKGTEASPLTEYEPSEMQTLKLP